MNGFIASKRPTRAQMAEVAAREGLAESWVERLGRKLATG
jgi:hypothetical protein